MPMTCDKQVYEAILSLGTDRIGLVLEWGETSQLLVLPSGERFRLDHDGVTRLD
jgi:hypothetical protein